MDTINDPLPDNYLGEQELIPLPPVPTPNDPPWSTLVGISMWIASVLAIIILPTIFVLPYLIANWSNFTESAALGEFLQKDPTAIILQVISVVPAHLITLALAWMVVTKMRRFSFTDMLGWRSGGMKWWHYLAIVGGFFVVAALVGTYFPEQDNEMIRILKSSRAAVFLVAFMATFTAPIVEEVIYRGLLYSALQRAVGVTLAVIIVTFLFALVHLPQYYPSVSTMFLLVLLSLALTLVRVRTDNLLPCIILHTVFNATQSILLILEPYVKTVDPVIEPAASILLLK